MGLKDTLIQKLESQIDAWEKQVEAERAKAKQKQADADAEKAGAKLQEQIMNNVSSMQQNIKNARKKIEELRNAGEDRIQDLNKQIKDWIG